MIELAATAIITFSSAVLFGYWFRYTCLLILSAKTTRDYAEQVAEANQLSFLTVQRELAGGLAQDLDWLHASLDRDYQVLARLWGQAPREGGLERRMLQTNYRLMSFWGRLVKSFFPQTARKALEEMALTIAHFANALGEQSAAAAAA